MTQTEQTNRNKRRTLIIRRWTAYRAVREQQQSALKPDDPNEAVVGEDLLS